MRDEDHGRGTSCQRGCVCINCIVVPFWRGRVRVRVGWCTCGGGGRHEPPPLTFSSAAPPPTLAPFERPVPHLLAHVPSRRPPCTASSSSSSSSSSLWDPLMDQERPVGSGLLNLGAPGAVGGVGGSVGGGVPSQPALHTRQSSGDAQYHLPSLGFMDSDDEDNDGGEQGGGGGGGGGGGMVGVDSIPAMSQAQSKFGFDNYRGGGAAHAGGGGINSSSGSSSSRNQG